jgi:diadenylate cyclase
MSDDALRFDYESSPNIRRLVERLTDCAESLSLGFDGYGEAQIKGPGLYVAVVTGRSVAAYADPMGSNRWPVETCENLLDDFDRCYEAVETVASSCDGGVVVGVDGTVLEQMVRFRNVNGGDLPPDVSLADLEYADWMGARHMSAYELSLRPDVVVTITLGEEDGRVTTFDDGEYESVPRSSLGEPWRATE